MLTPVLPTLAIRLDSFERLSRLRSGIETLDDIRSGNLVGRRGWQDACMKGKHIDCINGFDLGESFGAALLRLTTHLWFDSHV